MIDDLTVPDPTPLLRLRDRVYADDLVIVAVAELDLFTQLVHGPLSNAELATELDLAPRPTLVMCELLQALGLLETDGRGLAPSALARAYLTDGAPRDLRPYFASLRDRPGVQELLAVLRTGEPAAWASAAGGEDWVDRLDDPEFAEQITAAMDARGRVLAPALAAVLADVPMHSVLDIAGGSGVYACALLDAAPQARATVLERPPVDRAARTLLRRRGYGGVDVVTADMFDALPIGHDLHLYAHVFHDWDVQAIQQLLCASYAALPSGGWVVDYDAHLNQEQRAPVAAYSVLLMHSTRGRCYSVAEIESFMRTAGFVDLDVRPTTGDRSAVLGRHA